MYVCTHVTGSKQDKPVDVSAADLLVWALPLLLCSLYPGGPFKRTMLRTHCQLKAWAMWRLHHQASGLVPLSPWHRVSCSLQLRVMGVCSRVMLWANTKCKYSTGTGSAGICWSLMTQGSSVNPAQLTSIFQEPLVLVLGAGGLCDGQRS